MQEPALLLALRAAETEAREATLTEQAARPRDKEPYPSELREAFAVLLRLLYGGAEPEVDELTRARGRLEEASGERAELGILLAPLRQAEGNAQVALELAQARREPKSLARWFVARALAPTLSSHLAVALEGRRRVSNER